MELYLLDPHFFILRFFDFCKIDKIHILCLFDIRLYMETFYCQEHHPKVIQSNMTIILSSEHFPKAKKLMFLLLDLVGFNHGQISHFIPVR